MDKISSVLLKIALAIACIAIIVAVANFFIHGDNSNNKGNIATAARFLVFAILIFVYRKIFIRK